MVYPIVFRERRLGSSAFAFLLLGLLTLLRVDRVREAGLGQTLSEDSNILLPLSEVLLQVLSTLMVSLVDHSTLAGTAGRALALEADALSENVTLPGFSADNLTTFLEWALEADLLALLAKVPRDVVAVTIPLLLVAASLATYNLIGFQPLPQLLGGYAEVGFLRALGTNGALQIGYLLLTEDTAALVALNRLAHEAFAELALKLLGDLA